MHEPCLDFRHRLKGVQLALSRNHVGDDASEAVVAYPIDHLRRSVPPSWLRWTPHCAVSLQSEGDVGRGNGHHGKKRALEFERIRKELAILDEVPPGPDHGIIDFRPLSVFGGQLFPCLTQSAHRDCSQSVLK